MRRTTSSVALMAEKQQQSQQQQQQQQQQHELSISSVSPSSSGNVAANGIADHHEQLSSPTASSAKELNWRKLTKGYALRTVLALRASRRGPLITLALLLLTLCLLAAVTVRQSAGRVTASPSTPRYAVYIDGGSSGTRVHVFLYTLAPWPQYARLVLPEPNHSVEPGLSHYFDNAPGAGLSLEGLLEFAYAQVPRHLWASTPVRLLATAGLRLLTGEQQQAILSSCRTVLQSSHFVFQPEWATVIKGDMEGIYSWVGANYASGALEAAQLRKLQLPGQARRALDSGTSDRLTLQPGSVLGQADGSSGGRGSGGARDRSSDSQGEGGGAAEGGGTGVSGGGEGGAARGGAKGSGSSSIRGAFQGVLELGGASFQVTFLPASPGPQDARRLAVQLPGVKFKVFTHSYLGLGMDAAFARTAELIHSRAQSKQQQQQQQRQQQLQRVQQAGLGQHVAARVAVEAMQLGKADSVQQANRALIQQAVNSKLGHGQAQGQGNERLLLPPAAPPPEPLSQLLRREQEQAQGLEQHEEVIPVATAIEDPCLPLGYTAVDGRRGGSSFERCLEVALAVLPLSAGCHPAPSRVATTDPTSMRSVGSGVLLQSVATIQGSGDGAMGARTLLQMADGAMMGESITSTSTGGGSLGSNTGTSLQGAVGLAVDGRGGSRGAASSRGSRTLTGGSGVLGRATGSARRRCSMDGVEVPQLHGSFLAVENLYWTAKALGLEQHATLQELKEAGQRYCAQHWSSLQAQYSGHMPDQYITRYCFGAAYIFVLLHLGLGIGLDERRLWFTNTLPGRDGGHDMSLSWVTGAALVDAMVEERQAAAAGGTGSQQLHVVGSGRQARTHTQPAVVLLLTLVLLALLAATLLIVLPQRWLRGWWQGPESSSGAAATPASASSATPAAGVACAGVVRSGNDATISVSTASIYAIRAAPDLAVATGSSGMGSGAPPSPLKGGSTLRPSRLGPAANAAGGPIVRPVSLSNIDV